MKIARILVLVLMSFLFYWGFTQKISLSYLSFMNDKDIHLVVFILYPLATYFLIGNFKYKSIILFLLFLFLAVGVEFLQYFIPYRSACFLDIKFSVIGLLLSSGMIGYFK